MNSNPSSKKYIVLDSILCIPFLNIQYFSELSGIKELIIASRLVIMLVFLFQFLRHKYAKNIVYAFVAMAACMIYSTYQNGVEIAPAFSRYYAIFGIVLLAICRRNNYDRFMHSIYYASELFVYLNLLTMIIFRDGLYSERHWLIGQKQDFVTVFLVATMAGLYLWNHNEHRKRVICMFLAMFASLMIILTLGLTAVLVLLLAMCFFTKKFRVYIRAKKLFFFCCILEFSIVVASFFGGQFAQITALLGSIQASDELSKADTFMMRVAMWVDSVQTILKHPWGIGYLTEENFLTYINFLYHPHVHNMYIDLTLTSGLIAPCAFFYVNKYTFKRLDTVRSSERDLYTYVIFVMNILMLTECFYWPFAYAIYILALISVDYQRYNCYETNIQ